MIYFLVVIVAHMTRHASAQKLMFDHLYATTPKILRNGEIIKLRPHGI